MSAVIHEHVVLRVPKGDSPAGTSGYVVDAFPDTSSITVELMEDGETIDIVDCLRSEVIR